MMIGTAENRAFYDIAMRYKNAEGNWVEVDEANFPTGGVEVVLPYPNGTDSKDTFTIVHMLTTAARVAAAARAEASLTRPTTSWSKGL